MTSRMHESIRPHADSGAVINPDRKLPLINLMNRGHIHVEAFHSIKDEFFLEKDRGREYGGGYTGSAGRTGLIFLAFHQKIQKIVGKGGLFGEV